MTRIGKKPIPVPDRRHRRRSSPRSCASTGPEGELAERKSARHRRSRRRARQLLVTRPTDRGEHRALHGLTRSLIANMVEGVTDGFEKTLEIQGVGYRAALKGRDLELALGYSHPVPIKAPRGHRVRGAAADARDRQGHHKQQVGEIAAIIRKQRPAGALQGQGHPLRGRVRRPEGR